MEATSGVGETMTSAVGSRLAKSLLCAWLGLICCAARGDYVFIDLYSMLPPAGFSAAFESQYPHTAGGGQVAGWGYGTSTNFQTHAVIWASDGTSTNLTPAGVTTSYARATNGTQQVGEGATAEGTHAFLWTGSAASGVDLHPAGLAGSQAWGMDGTQQVGDAWAPGTTATHAYLWTGSAGSAVDLQPSGFGSSMAWATRGGWQVGEGAGTATGGLSHALLWNGSAASVVDLNPAGFTFSSAQGIYGQQQVGYGGSPDTGNDHALLWNGTAASAVDLHVAGFDLTHAVDTNGEFQVGFGRGNLATGNQFHALLWHGSASSAVDLGALAPSFSYLNSIAYSIDDAGNVFGVATDANNTLHAVEWSNVPEPTGISSIAFVIGLWTMRRQSRK